MTIGLLLYPLPFMDDVPLREVGGTGFAGLIETHLERIALELIYAEQSLVLEPALGLL